MKVVDFIAEEAYDKCLKALEKANENWHAGISWGAVRSTKGNDVGIAASSACHAWVNAAYRQLMGGVDGRAVRKGASNFIIANCYKPAMRTCSVEAAEAFVMWLATKSPFVQYILNREDEDSLKNQGVILYCGPDGLCHTECLWVCKSMRYAIESGQAMDAWYAAYKGGVHPMIALAAAQHFRQIQQTPKGKVFKYFEAQITHNSVFYYLDKKHVPELLASKPFKFSAAAATLFTDNGKYKRNNDYGAYESELKDFLATNKSFSFDDGWGGKIKVNGVPEEELVKMLLEFQHQGEGLLPTHEKEIIVTRDTIYLEGDL